MIRASECTSAAQIWYFVWHNSLACPTSAPCWCNACQSNDLSKGIRLVEPRAKFRVNCDERSFREAFVNASQLWWNGLQKRNREKRKFCWVGLEAGCPRDADGYTDWRESGLCRCPLERSVESLRTDSGSSAAGSDRHGAADWTRHPSYSLVGIHRRRCCVHSRREPSLLLHLYSSVFSLCVCLLYTVEHCAAQTWGISMN